MALNEIREALGIQRVIWVDDVFGEPEEDLAGLASEQPDVQEEFPELAAAFAVRGYGEFDAELSQAIEDLGDDRREELRLRLLQGDAEGAPAQELAPETIEQACNELDVSEADRWSFEKADAFLANNGDDDSTVAYMIDLKEGGGPDKRGLDILAQLRANHSAGVAFILTHEAAVDTEAAVERQLTRDIGPAAGLAPPITVISKGRLTDEGANVQSALAVALKRAGLRRALYRVLKPATVCATEAFSSTASSLLEVEPERLEHYVYERGRAEGVSELNVVERALSAGASLAMRSFFGTDGSVLQAIRSVRELQGIPLEPKPLDAGPVLIKLRNAEVWDDADIINAALTPLANGDVFRFDESEPGLPASPKLFVILGQPCDLMVRPDGRRFSEVAMFVPLTTAPDDGPLVDPNDPDEDDAEKAQPLPFRLDGKRYNVNLKQMTYARLGVLDLATFRADGCVRVEVGHTPSPALLGGAKSIYPQRTAAPDDLLLGPMPAPPAGGVRPPVDDRLLLTMSDGNPWKRTRVGVRLPQYTPPQGHHLKSLPERVTWYLRRHGRIRPPYSSFLLERALRTLGRRAFDTDYTSFK